MIKIRRILSNALAVLLAAGTMPAAAYADDALTLSDVLESSIRHHPIIISSLENVNATRGKVLSAQGAFDAEINQRSDLYATGFYSGRSVDTRIEKPLRTFGANVYTGYRVSDGTYPVYEDQNITNAGGEYNIGVMFSLLRNRAIDERRFKVASSKLDRDIAEFDLLLTKISVQNDAMQAYMDWLAAGQQLRITRDLLTLADDRQEALTTRTENGDEAKIALVENNQYVLRRQAQENEAMRIFVNFANRLSLFLRDAEGNPRVPDYKNLPPNFPMVPHGVMSDLRKAIANARSSRPELKALQAGIEQAEYQQQLGENRILPKVDVALEGNNDTGGGTNSREEAEAKVKFNVSIPLQTRAGRGMVVQAKAKQRQLQENQRFLNDRIAAELQSIANDLEAAERFIKITDKEITAATTMQVAEQERVRSGASNFFVLNLREEQLADARARNARAKATFFKALADYYAATVQTEKLEIHAANRSK